MLLVFAIINSLLIVKSFADHNWTCDHSAGKPTDEILKQRYHKWLGTDFGLHSTFFNLQPPLYKNRYKDINSDTKGVLRKAIYGRPKCTKQLSKTSVDLMDISLCPWYIEMTYDTDRYPEKLANAICKCKHCYSFKGVMKEQSKCKEIKQMVKVLRVQKNDKAVRICESGDNKHFLYKNTYEEINVGCTCVRKDDKRIRHRKIRIKS